MHQFKEWWARTRVAWTILSSYLAVLVVVVALVLFFRHLVGSSYEIHTGGGLQ